MRLRPANFVDRLRVACRKVIYFQKRMAKKGPQYLSCNERQTSCTRAKRNPRNGCPDCEYTIQYKIFIKELEAELKRIPKSTYRGYRIWPVQRLLDTVAEVATMAHSRKGINPKWSMATSIFVSVYRDESAKIQAIESFTPDPKTNTGPVDEEGDFN